MNLTNESKQSDAMEIGKDYSQKSKKLHSTFSVSSLLSNHCSNSRKSTEASEKDFQCPISAKSTSSKSLPGVSSKDSSLDIAKPNAKSADNPSGDVCQLNNPLPSASNFVPDDSGYNPSSEATRDLIPSIPKCLPVNYLCQKDNLDTELSLVTMSMENMTSKELFNKRVLQSKSDLGPWYSYPIGLHGRLQPFSAESGFKWENAYDLQVPKLPIKNNVLCNFGWLNRCGLDSVSRMSPREQLQVAQPNLLNDAQNTVPSLWIPCLPCNPTPGVDGPSNSK